MKRIKVHKNPEAPWFGGVYQFPWEVHCPEHGEVDGFIAHGMAMNEVDHHLKTEHNRQEKK